MPSKIVIAILTYRREKQLALCVSSVIDSIKSVDHSVTILIGDNDLFPSVQEYGHGEDLRRIHLRKGAIAPGRQELLLLARRLGFDYIVFVDDDEIVSIDWLRLLLDTAIAYDCAGVTGPVSPIGLPDGELPLHIRARRLTGNRMDTAGAGNLLLKLDRIVNIDFNIDWPMRGGEDTDFTYRITKSGKEIIWCDEAEVFEPVDISRRSVFWLVNRYFNNGRVLHSVFRDSRTMTSPVGVIKRLCYASFILIMLPGTVFSPRITRFILDKSIRNFGFVFQAFNNFWPFRKLASHGPSSRTQDS
ncbi:glycosyltransferase family 2 protein [Pseudarthrobacter sp. P1]|uniref:glycosyltransferase family 2 protein n=1 Tax=Pseudarthrobacter sp. P1 TaxID=3418418 RepID=UPI003CF87151